MPRPRPRLLNRAAVARALGFILVAALIATATIYLASHEGRTASRSAAVPSSSSILIEDEA